MSCCRAHQAPADETDAADAAGRLFGHKTRERLTAFAAQRELALDRPWSLDGAPAPGLARVAELSLAQLPKPAPACIVHGDFCFSNILYDFRSQAIKVVDPRGLDADGRPTLFGDPHYDVAKWAHSVIGRYDFIIAGYYQLQRDGQALHFELPSTPAHNQIEAMFIALCAERYGLSEVQLLAMQVQLFLAMLPLHGDDLERQMALLANALRLWLRLEARR